MLLLSSTDCGCNPCFHLVPVSCHYYRVHVQNLSVCVSYVALCCCWVKKKRVLCYRIHIEFACSEAFFKSAILMHSDFRIIFFLSMTDAKCALFYFSIIVFNNCFHTITQDIQLSTLILYLFYYNLLLYHSYDY